MTVTTRFAPSPTGRLHVGNVRTALINALLARRHGGRFLLRIDDTDTVRSREDFVTAIRDDLAWLGLTPDAEVRQSERFALYERRFDELSAAGRVYRCYETAQELDLKRKILLGRGLPPIYDRAAVGLSDADHARYAAQGVVPHWRFKLDHERPIDWDDGIRGAQRFDPATMSDPVVRRADGTWLYMLPSVIDDVDLAVTDIVRGEDHVSNTAAQIQMFAALGAPLPRFAHAALLIGSEGKLAKRLGSLGVAEWREQGIEPEAVIALLARIGTSDPVDPALDPADLAGAFDLSRFGRAPARFDEAELARTNAAVLHRLPFHRVAAHLPQAMDAAAWEAIRPNLTTLADAETWWRVITGPVPASQVAHEDRDFLLQAADIAAADWPADPWSALTGALKDATGRKGKALFLPLRRALTGADQGPEMTALLPLIGQAGAVARLRSAAG
jgi:glutamyl-tRNA synthetase